MRLAFALLLTLVARGSDADRAARRADALLRGDEAYRRLCETRVSDGYVITYDLIPRPNIASDVSPWPVVVVPDSGAPWIARESFTHEGANGGQSEPLPEPPPPLDSATIVQIAESKAGPMARVHCYIPLPRAGGAFVQMLSRTSSAKGPTLDGVVIGVEGDRGTAVFTF
jgi:hypothetical protein